MLKYQINLKIHHQNYDLTTDEDDFALFLYKNILEDFEVDDNNSRLDLLNAYVKKVYALYQQEQSIENIIDKLDI